MREPQNLISKPTRRNIADELTLRDMHPNGRLDEVAFFSRLFDLKALPTHDYRKNDFPDMAADIWQHRVNNHDWEDGWWWTDERLIAAAKDLILAKLTGTAPFQRRLALRDLAEERVRECGEAVPAFIELDDDPVPTSNAMSMNISLRAGVFVGATELANAGHVLRAGTTAVYEPEMPFSSGHGRHRAGETIDLAIPYPETIYVNPLSEAPTKLSDPDIYVRDLVVDGLHPGIAEALTLALKCMRQELWVPALAMLGAASEGAWVEAGTAIANAVAGTSGTKLKNALEDPSISIRRKIALISEAYVPLKPLHTTSGVRPPQLAEVANWSNVVRESRNVLHWGARPSTANSYAKVSALLLGAIPTLKVLRHIESAAISSLQEHRGAP